MRSGPRKHRVVQLSSLSVLVGVGVVLGGCSSGSAGKVAPTHNRPVSSPSSTSPSALTAAGSSEVLSGESQAGSGAVVPIVLQRDDVSNDPGTVTGKPGWPRYSPSVVVVPAGKQVTLIILNYDDAPTPLPTRTASYDNVQGGIETVNGKTVSSISNEEIAHTFTVPGLGINVPIPVATDGGSATAKTITPAVVTFTFTPAKSGSFTFRCYTPCGSGSEGTGGAMATPGWMQGTLRVTA